MNDVCSLLSIVGRDLSIGLGLLLDFWYHLVVPEAILGGRISQKL